MGRRLFSLAALASLLVFFAGIFVFTFYQREGLRIGTQHKWCDIYPLGNHFVLSSSFRSAPPGPLIFDIYRLPLGVDLILTNEESGHNHNVWVHRLDVPYLLFIAATLILPLLRFRILPTFRRRRQQARAAQGQCVHCGYDLRATLDRCPECGTAVSIHDNKKLAG